MDTILGSVNTIGMSVIRPTEGNERTGRKIRCVSIRSHSQTKRRKRIPRYDWIFSLSRSHSSQGLWEDMMENNVRAAICKALKVK